MMFIFFLVYRALRWRKYITDRGFESHSNIVWLKYLKTDEMNNFLEKDVIKIDSNRIGSQNKQIAMIDTELIIILNACITKTY